MNFKDIKINIKEEYNTFIFNNQEIKVLKYLPIEEKFDLIMVALQKSNINGVYNPIRLKTFLDLNKVYLYTDIQFDVEDRVDEGALYDNLLRSGLLSEIDKYIEDSEKVTLNNMFKDTLEAEVAYRNTAASIISKLVDDLPKNVEAAKEAVENFDPKKFGEVLDFAKAINA